MPPIFVLLPVVILAFSALILAVIARLQPAFRSTWLIAVSSVLLAWLVTVVLRWLLPQPLVLAAWLPFGDPEAGSLRFQIDSISWPYALSLTALLLAIMITASARLQPQQNPWPWAGSISLTGMGLLAVTSGNPLTLTLAWTAIDLVELVVVLNLVGSTALSRQAVVAFSSRVIGTLIVITAGLYNFSTGVPFTFDTIQPLTGLLLLIAAGLRLGVIPLHLPYSQELPVRRGLGTTMRLVAAASTLPLLARLPGSLSQSSLVPILLGLSILASLYGAAMWLAARDELQGRPYWLVSTAGLVVISSLQGQQAASVAWGVCGILAGGSLFLFSARSRGVLFLVLLSILGLSGLPYTPSSSGWLGLVSNPLQPYQPLMILTLAMLLAGLVRHALRPGEPLQGFDRWVQTIYPLGFMAPPLSQWLAAIFGPAGSLTPGFWWPGLVTLALMGVGVFILLRQRPRIEGLRQGWLGIVSRRVALTLAGIFRFTWLYRLFWSLYEQIQRLIHFLTVILEGEGGVLWALVLLALLVSLLTTVGRP